MRGKAAKQLRRLAAATYEKQNWQLSFNNYYRHLKRAFTRGDRNAGKGNDDQSSA